MLFSINFFLQSEDTVCVCVCVCVRRYRMQHIMTWSCCTCPLQTWETACTRASLPVHMSSHPGKLCTRACTHTNWKLGPGTRLVGYMYVQKQRHASTHTCNLQLLRMKTRAWDAAHIPYTLWENLQREYSETLGPKFLPKLKKSTNKNSSA